MRLLKLLRCFVFDRHDAVQITRRERDSGGVVKVRYQCIWCHGVSGEVEADESAYWAVKNKRKK